MLKFLRKYDKWILAVGGSLLMVVFLLPQAMQQLGGNPRDKVIATFAGGSITYGQRIRAQQEVNTLEMMHGSIPYLLLGLDREHASSHWLLLAAEAKRAGFIAGPEDGAQFLDLAATELGRIYAQQYFGETGAVSPQMVSYIQDNFFDQLLSARQAMYARGLTNEAELLRIESIAMGILRLHKTYFEAPKLSDIESVSYAKKQADQVAVNFAILRPTRILPEIPQPSAEEVQAHFEMYRDVVPGEGEYGFGYRLFPGIKMEWVEISREAIADSVTVDPIEANSYWRANRGSYPETWADAKEQVEQDLRNAEVDRTLDDIDRFMVGELRKRERNLPSDGRFKALPPDWDLIRPSLQATVDNALRQTEQSRSLDLPEIKIAKATENFYIQEDADRFGGIDNATLQRGPNSVDFETLVFNTREINPDTPYDIQVGLTYGPLKDADGNVYYFVLTDARPAQPAEMTLDIELRCRSNMRKLQAMNALIAGKDNIIAEVAEKGMEGFATEYDLLEVDVGERVAVGRRFVNPVQSMDFDQQSIRDAILDRADTLDPTVPASQLPPNERILVVPSPKALSAVVVEIIDNRPLTVESYRINVDRAEQIARQDLYFERVEQWPFSWPAMTVRMDYTDFSVEDEERAEEAEAATADASAGE